MEPERVHGENCGGAPGVLCVRCTGFPKGHELRITHGAYAAPYRLAERAGEVAGLLAEVVPVRSPADSPLIGLVAITLVRIERAAAALEQADAAGESMPALEAQLRSWVSLSSRLLEQAGMSPQARAALGLTLTELEQARRRSLNLGLLSDDERDELERLIAKAGAA